MQTQTWSAQLKVHFSEQEPNSCTLSFFFFTHVLCIIQGIIYELERSLGICAQAQTINYGVPSLKCHFFGHCRKQAPHACSSLCSSKYTKIYKKTSLQMEQPMIRAAADKMEEKAQNFLSNISRANRCGFIQGQRRNSEVCYSKVTSSPAAWSTVVALFASDPEQIQQQTTQPFSTTLHKTSQKTKGSEVTGERALSLQMYNS